MMKPVADFAAKQLGHCPTGLVAFTMQDLKVTMPGPAAVLKDPEREVLKVLNIVSGERGLKRLAYSTQSYFEKFGDI